MLKRIRGIHPLFYMPLAFLAFPVLGAFFLLPNLDTWDNFSVFTKLFISHTF